MCSNGRFNMPGVGVNTSVLTLWGQLVKHICGATTEIKYATCRWRAHEHVDHTLPCAGTTERILQGAIQLREPHKTVGA